ncbi:MAG: FAD-binding oxidoreductase [Anaerolineae bacterium]
MIPKTAGVVIIGGGVMGASVAYHLAKRGVRDVLLLERERFFGQGATGRCAGGIRHQFSSEVNIRLSIHSIRMLEAFEAEMGQPIDLKQTGYLFLLSTPEEMAQFRANVALQNALGVASRLLTPDEIQARVPLLNLDGIIGGAFCDRDGIADPASVVQGFVKQARAHGATLVNDATVTGVLVEGGRVRGVETAQGRVSAPVVVNAAGPWAGLVAAMAGVTLPITPERQQIAVTAPLAGLPPDFPFVIDFSQRLYFHMEGEGLLTGQSIVGQPPTFDQSVDGDWTAYHIGNAMARLPLLESAYLMSEWAGLYENTPDAHPIIGPVTALEGFYVVAGFSGHGFMHGPIAGQLIAEQILGLPTTVDVTPLRWDRFAEASAVAEFNVV